MKDFIADLPFVGEFMTQRPKVAVIRLSGVIADAGMRKNGVSLAKYGDLIEKAFEVRDLREVAIIINSPGGAPAQSSLIANVIRDCAQDKKMPVSAFVEDVAASGGYWLACAADKIYAQGSSLVGSIGVIAASFGLEDFIKKHNIKRRVYTSGTEKSMLDPFLPEKQSDIDRITALQAEIHGQFITWVKERRGSRLVGKDSDLFNGQIWTGEGAKAAGLIDGIGDLRSVYHDKYGDEVRFIAFEPDRPFFQSLMGVKAASISGDTLVEQALAAVEDRSFWSKYGL